MTWKMICCPFARVGRVAHGPVPGDGHAEIVAERGIDGDRRRVGEDDDSGRHRPLLDGRGLHGKNAAPGGRSRGGDSSGSTDPPAAPTAATPTALLKIFLRLSALREPCTSVPPGSETASLEPDARQRVEDCLPNGAPLVS